ncbi:MAG: hypothetical protein WDZ51_19990 [Pirellulaceae bacterium]
MRMFLNESAQSTSIGGLALIAVVLMVFGCSRGQYREQADQEVTCLVTEKSFDPRWAYPNFSIDLDPRSRYYDPYNLEEPPMPEDDPSAHRYMHYVDGKRGWKHWHRNGDRPGLESPYWEQLLYQYANVDEEGRIILSLEDSVRLAVLHSPDYQRQTETLYLSALDVSTERFRFDVQFFGGSFTEYTHLGQLNPGGESNTLRLDHDAVINRRTATAGEIMVGLANSTVWEFAGPNRGVTTSILNFNLIQPLLRAGGRAVALEQLTIAERGLLANMRAFARYRQGFFCDVAIGDSGVSGLQRRGGFFGGTGLTGFTGQGSGGFGGVGEATGFGRGFFGGAGGAAGGGGTGFAGGGAGTVGGFTGLLQQLQQIRNTQDSLNAQLRTLELLEANLDAGLIDIAQVDQFRQNIETERANLLQASNNLEATLDTFKRGTLGLPPDLPVTLDDSLIEQFKLIDPRTNQTQLAIEDYITEFGEFPEQPEAAVLSQAIAKVHLFQQQVQRRIDATPEDLAGLVETMPRRKVEMTEREQALQDRELERLQSEQEDLDARSKLILNRIDELRANLSEVQPARAADQIVSLLVDMKNITSETALVQASARLEQIVVERIDLDAPTAVEIARANRLDWMNNRAALVDTWRLIEFNANALRSDLTVRFSGDMQTVGNNPVDFRGQTGSLQASLQFDPPFTRLLERNSFRQQLITYQQDRRQLIQFEDSVSETMRGTLRKMEELRVNLEIQRRAVAIAIRRVDQTREALNRPVPPSEPGQPAASLGPTAAQNLLFALSDLRNTQNNLMSVWLNYEATRLRLHRELGLMEIDEEGLWVDRPLALADRLSAEEVELPPSVPQEWFDEEFLEQIPETIEEEPSAQHPGDEPASSQIAQWWDNVRGKRSDESKKEEIRKTASLPQDVAVSYTPTLLKEAGDETGDNSQPTNFKRLTRSEIDQMIADIRRIRQAEAAAVSAEVPKNPQENPLRTADRPTSRKRR